MQQLSAGSCRAYPVRMGCRVALVIDCSGLAKQIANTVQPIIILLFFSYPR